MSKPTDKAAKGRQRPTARPSSKGSSKSRLSRRLWEWATKDMKYAGEEEGALGQADLQVLLRGDELAGLLEFVVEHIKPPSEAEAIRGNLLLHSAEGRGGEGDGDGGRDAGRGEVERERRRLAREEASLRMAVEQMTKDIAQLRENVTQLAEAGHGVQRDVSRLSRGSALLSAHSHARQEMTRALREFTRRIRARTELFQRPKGKEACFFTRQEPGREEEEKGRGGGGGGRGGGGRGEGGDRREGTVLESACTHSVRVICSQLEETLSESHSGHQSEAERKRGMDHSWKQIESLLTHHTPGDILSSLEEVTLQATSHLHSHTLSINLSRDAQQLRYSYDSQCGGMKDVSEQPSLLHAVEEQLLEGQLSHIRRSVESEHARRAAEKARIQTAELQAEIGRLLEETYHRQPDGEEALELAKQLHTQLDLKCAGSLAVLERLGSICSSLDEARNQRRSAIDELRAKLGKIQEFAQVAESKQKLIRALVAHNSSARDRIQHQYRELQMYVEESVLGHHEELTRAASVLRDSVAREIQAFSRLSLDRLLKPPSSEVPTCDLSVNRLGSHQPSGRPSWATVTRSLRLPSNSAGDGTLSHLLTAQEKVGRLEGNVSEVNQALQEMRVATVNKDDTRGLLQRCRERDCQLLERGIPALQECLSRASSGLADCERTSETLDHWWSQPAQFLTPWATQSGLTAQQWVEQWRVVTAKFSELQGLQY